MERAKAARIHTPLNHIPVGPQGPRGCFFESAAYLAKINITWQYIAQNLSQSKPQAKGTMDENEHAPSAEQPHEYNWDFLEHIVEPTGEELARANELSPEEIDSLLESFRLKGPEDILENLPYLDALAYFARIELGKLVFDWLNKHPFGLSRRDSADGGKPEPDTLSVVNRLPPSKIPREVYPRLLGRAVRSVMPHVPDKETSFEITREIMSLMMKAAWVDRKAKQKLEEGWKLTLVSRPKKKRRTNEVLRQMATAAFEDRKKDGKQDELLLPGSRYQPQIIQGRNWNRPARKRTKIRHKIPHEEQLGSGSILAQVDDNQFLAVFGKFPER